MDSFLLDSEKATAGLWETAQRAEMAQGELGSEEALALWAWGSQSELVSCSPAWCSDVMGVTVASWLCVRLPQLNPSKPLGDLCGVYGNDS